MYMYVCIYIYIKCNRQRLCRNILLDETFRFVITYISEHSHNKIRTEKTWRKIMF